MLQKWISRAPVLGVAHVSRDRRAMKNQPPPRFGATAGLSISGGSALALEALARNHQVAGIVLADPSGDQIGG